MERYRIAYYDFRFLQEHEECGRHRDTQHQIKFTAFLIRKVPDI
jgi:hypothetical protein